jgi:hypothetical protein
MLDREALIAHFRRMPDEIFTRFATHEVGDLLPEAVEILRQEMVVRGTVADPDAVIDVQRRQLSSEEFERMVARVRQQPCPFCGASGDLLNGALVNRGGTAERVIGCRPCLEQQLKSADKASTVVGLFHLGAGLKAVDQNEASLRELESGNQTQALREYVWYNRGELVHFLK